MRFQKINSGPSNTTPLSADDIVKANRWEEREAKRKASHLSQPIPPYERERVVRLYKQLIESISQHHVDPWRVKRSPTARGTDARQVAQYREAAEEHLGELMDRYAEAPASLSPALIAQNNSRMKEITPKAFEE